MFKRLMEPNNNKFYTKKENIFKDSKYMVNNETLKKEKTDILPYNEKHKKNSKIYIKLDPEYLENNYKKAEQYNYNANKTYTYNPNYNDNNNLQSEKIFKKKSLYLKKKADINSPVKINVKYLNYNNNTISNINYKKNSFNENRTLSPIKKYIEKKNFNFYINNGVINKRNRRDNLDEEIFINKSLELNRLNNRNMTNYLNDSKTFHTQRNNDITFLNIYQKKMIIIFVQIINKIIEKNKIRSILNLFFNQLKRDIFNNVKNKNKSKYQKINTKYNEYKNIMNKYAKNIFKDKTELNNNNKENNSDIKINNKTLKIKNNDINIKKKLKEMQKKYGKIYQRKKNNLNKAFNYNKYILRKTKTQNTFVKSNDIKNNEILNEKNILKYKLLNNKLLKSRRELIQINLSQDFHINDNYINKNIFNELSNSIDYSKEKYYTKREKTKPKNENKVINLKLKINKRLNESTKRENKNNKNYEIYEIYNIKNIITPDKRLYVFIKYIALHNDKRQRKERLINSYDIDSFRISNQDSFIIYGINKNSNIKNQLNINFFKNIKKLSEIEEDPNDIIFASANKDEQKTNIIKNI